MLTVLIAEDDPAMRHVLNKTLSQIPGVEVLGEAGDGITALKMVEKLNPRVVFIDIDLPGKNGVELAREICDIYSQTILIFATAYDDHIHEAFEVYAFDYLVKPFKLDRIKKTMERIKQQERQRSPVPTNHFVPPVAETNPARLVIRQNEKLIFLDTQDIIFITREKRKTVIVTSIDKISITESLNSVETRLTGNTFFRSHRAYIVNLNMIREICSWGKNGYEITFSGTRQTAILALNKARELEKTLVLPGS
ncbi:two component transcriptional regulator, LytTR family [Desulfotomaculum arcticum]|uniref:Stage 0 sporulation protein A homolog n=1 Tax=Desulfotruncus arcticus DSM 17038 TaxID=1121424 RepID=A0A1I2R5D7_9FIRM|nr:LytTR family DNA-binding domain-containing protein [Desulfotruncus arcticus]SFG35692.1 two component transcriptional regulator, LytTR family [Desulfotomaculum arcticum] [Desulfotruncus arcticus DSM 17038]